MRSLLTKKRDSYLKGYVSPATSTPGWRICDVTSFKKLVTLFLQTLLFLSTGIAQTTTTFPPATSCTSKDLELVSATITGGDACNSCTPGTIITRTLTLAINNKTGSTRTAFAFWGKLVRTHTDGTRDTVPISQCSGPIPPTGPLPASYSQNFGNVTYNCGDALKIINLFLAWTDASPKSTCATINSATINPKCGTLPEIQINAGVTGTSLGSDATCAGSDGAIDLTPSGGTPFAAPAAPYTYSWSASNGGVVPSGQATHQDLTGLIPGTYTVRITDKNGCHFDVTTIINGPAALSAPSADVTQPTCTVATGTITVNNPDATLTYTLTGPSPATTTQSNSTGTFSSLAAGTYGLTATKGVCTSPSTSKTVNAQPSTPDKPTIVVTQPSLCGPSKGSIQICSPTAGWTYHIGSADITAQANTAVIFTDLSAGSNPVVTVTNTDGCTSSGSVCDDAVESCPSLTRIQQNSIIGAAEESELKVTAYPNPFNDKINFVVNAPVSGKGTLEVYNSLGQKIKTVYQGTINKGMQNFELRLPVRQQANLIYVLRVGGKQLSGKILQLNQ